MNTVFSEWTAEKPIYFAGDFHLGAPSPAQSLARERKIIAWLTSIAPQAHAIFLLGDVFDFWFEYKTVVPKGYVRFLGKLAELADQGIAIQLFAGNHDLWLKDYLVQEIGLTMHDQATSFVIGSKTFYIAHGDGLGPGNRRFKRYKRCFTHPVCQRMFRALHPDMGVTWGKYWSNHSRSIAERRAETTKHKEQESLRMHSQSIDSKQSHDYYVYGHTHRPAKHTLPSGATYVNVGDWTQDGSFARFDGRELTLESYVGD